MEYLVLLALRLAGLSGRSISTRRTLGIIVHNHGFVPQLPSDASDRTDFVLPARREGGRGIEMTGAEKRKVLEKRY